MDNQPKSEILGLLPPKKQGGRPTKYGPVLVRRILKILKKGLPMTLACEAVGIEYCTFQNYRKKYPDFGAQIQQAIAHGIEKRLNIVLDAMESADENVKLRAATWWLTHSPIAASHFSSTQRVEVAGEFDARVAVLVWPHTRDPVTEINGNNSPTTSPDPD